MSDGVGFGYLYRYQCTDPKVLPQAISLDQVIQTVRKDLELTCANSQHLSETESMIFDAHQTLLQDENFISGIRKRIADGMTIGNAILENGKEKALPFLQGKDPDLVHIAEDIMDITYQMLDVAGAGKKQEKYKAPVVLYADDVLPSVLLKLLEETKVSAVLCRDNSDLSHSAIIARAAQIPMMSVFGFDLPDGTPLIVDGENGCITDHPDYARLLEINTRIRRKSADFRDFPIEVRGNAGCPEELEKISKSGRNIGLYRSEYFYLQKEKLPGDREVFLYLQGLIQHFAGNIFDYRVPDFGRDKLPAYLSNPSSENGIGFLLSEERILKQQIDAVKACSPTKALRLLLPFVQNAKQVIAVRTLLAPQDVPVGAMIETQMADETLEEIISESAFISIGTNDLICSISGSERISYRTASESSMDQMFSYIDHVCQAAKQHGISVCICGEIASDPKYTEKLLQTGIDSISVPYFHIFNIQN